MDWGGGRTGGVEDSFFGTQRAISLPQWGQFNMDSPKQLFPHFFAVKTLLVEFAPKCDSLR